MEKIHHIMKKHSTKDINLYCDHGVDIIDYDFVYNNIKNNLDLLPMLTSLFSDPCHYIIKIFSYVNYIDNIKQNITVLYFLNSLNLETLDDTYYNIIINNNLLNDFKNIKNLKCLLEVININECESLLEYIVDNNSFDKGYKHYISKHNNNILSYINNNYITDISNKVVTDIKFLIPLVSNSNIKYIQNDIKLFFNSLEDKIKYVINDEYINE